MTYSFVYTTVALLGLGTVHPGLDAETMRQPAPPPPPAVAAPATPAPMPNPAPAQAPVIASPAPSNSGAFTAHLASYLGETRAREGWTQLTGKVPALAGVEPHLVNADVPGRGPMVRLTAGTFASRAEALAFCAGVKEATGYCVPLPLPSEP